MRKLIILGILSILLLGFGCIKTQGPAATATPTPVITTATPTVNASEEAPTIGDLPSSSDIEVNVSGSSDLNESVW